LSGQEANLMPLDRVTNGASRAGFAMINPEKVAKTARNDPVALVEDRSWSDIMLRGGINF